MAETVTFREVKLESGWLMVKPERQDLGKAMALVRKHKDRLYDLEIKEHREKRSLDANAYAWVLIGKLAGVMRLKPLEVYQAAIRNLGGNYTVCAIPEKELERFCRSWGLNGLGWLTEPVGPSEIAGMVNVICYHGSSSYDTALMSRLIDNLVQDCKALDIETLSPEKLSLLKEEWH